MTAIVQHYTFRGSTRVESGTYDSEKKVLTLEFVDGTLWKYLKISPQTWQDLQSAPSAGKYVTEVLNHFHNHRA